MNIKVLSDFKKEIYRGKLIIKNKMNKTYFSSVKL